ncbi:Chemotaxis protein CheV [Fundidesulfovibrio magnetotacticus]|uniref:Chemotaxis protein CheV n=1 Tax=Fundidesulfovibrio magnetotacticus TaxID=2730080 RepID=A0A6V8M216_9BACT|nr:chemotaxis protein [Fundidesulfovibrio magnetotacticus]GFK95976.1 Chemotaxis protein CheV [Fundidesulfovibrio magnetotacticus]
MSQTNILLESGTNELEIVEFFIDEETEDGGNYRSYFGVNVAKVLEIIRKPKVTEMPSTPHPAVKGTFNLRSRIIPLIDLSIWLGKVMVRNEAPKVIVSEFNNITNAFLVSGVTRIHRLSWEQVEPPSGYVASFSSNSFTGVVKFEDRIVLLLDMEKIIWDLNPSLAMREEPDEEARVEATDEIAYRALVVDDSGSIRKLIVNTLLRDGYEVEQDINGQQAWERLVRHKQRAQDEGIDILELVNLVVTDIEMPAMDGHNLCKRIKDDPVLRDIPVILFSSLINEKLFHKGTSVGADDQITKPEITTLTQRSKALIEQKGRPRPRSR